MDVDEHDLVSVVQDALRSVSSGDYEIYNQIVGALSGGERTLVKVTLKALSKAANYIDSDQHERLLSTIFSMSFWRCWPDVTDAVAKFLVSLAVSDGEYLDCCLNHLSSQFLPPPNFDVKRKEQVVSHVHSALEKIAVLYPFSPLKLVPVVLKGFDINYVQNLTTSTLVTYVENILKLESGPLGEVVRVPLLTGVVELLVELDVKISWEDIAQAESSTGIFEMELENVDKCADDDDVIDDNALSGELSRNSFADKLDNVMAITLEHLESCAVGGRLIEVFQTLLESFERTVLTTFELKFAPFVIFYASALDPGNCGLTFALMLENIFFCSKIPLHRVSAIVYLASYLARAKFLSVTVVADTMGRLVDWCFEYYMQDEEINSVAHKLFYSGCQAVMYLLCFRMRSMMDVPELKSWLVKLPLESILNSKLKPLEVCNPYIVKEFLQQAKAVGLFMTFEKFKFDDNIELLIKKEKEKEESKHSKDSGGVERLDMFFPFDPCLLKKSDSYVRPNYIFWSMVQGVFDDDEDSSDEGVNVDGMGCVKEEQHFGFDEMDSGLKQMSITPKDSYFWVRGVPMPMPSRIRPSTSPESL